MNQKTETHGEYSYRVTWSEDDAEYVGICAEFSSLSWLAQSPEATLNGVCKLVTEVIEDMIKSGETVPKPLATTELNTHK